MQAIFFLFYYFSDVFSETCCHVDLNKQSCSKNETQRPKLRLSFFSGGNFVSQLSTFANDKRTYPIIRPRPIDCDTDSGFEQTMKISPSFAHLIFEHRQTITLFLSDTRISSADVRAPKEAHIAGDFRDQGVIFYATKGCQKKLLLARRACIQLPFIQTQYHMRYLMCTGLAQSY